jgi:hypothetical protein
MSRSTAEQLPDSAWPELSYNDWQDTRSTLHMWTQVVGKIRLALAPMVNHWWQTPLYVTARGLSTSPMPYGQDYLQIDFDFHDRRLRIDHSRGAQRALSLEPRSVADFHAELMARLAEMGTPVKIWTRPVEVEVAIPFEEDHEHASYDRDAAHRFFQTLRQADRLMHAFRSGFQGKVSPVHFFWGSFDHAVSRFSGRGAPPHPGGIPNLADWVTREAYSHELSSCGFWPGDARYPQAAFYAYAYPEPAGFRDTPVAPETAFYHPTLSEYVLPYGAVRQSADPDRAALDFLQSTYDAAADRGGWDRQRLERTATGNSTPTTTAGWPNSSTT